MNRTQFQKLLQQDPDSRMLWAHSILGSDRTLLFGYTCNRESWHVYLRNRLIHLYVYTGFPGQDPVRYEALEAWDVRELIPDKRVYPESTDAGFARAVRRMGIPVPYLLFDDERWSRRAHKLFHGEVAPTE